jgi:predicted nucleic acid-binding protein
MRVFLDTNVLVAACLEDHEQHARALPVVQRVHEKKVEGALSAHSILETHSVLTRLPRHPRISPSQAGTLIADNFLNYFSIIALSSPEYSVVFQKLRQQGIIL